MKARLIALGMSTVAAGAYAQSKPYKTVDPADLLIGYRKHVEREIEVRGLICYHADKDDYRCAAPSVAVAIFTKDITPVTAKQHVEDHCGEIRKAALTPKCRLTLRFLLKEEDVENDVVSGFQQRAVISPDSVEALIPSGQRRGR